MREKSIFKNSIIFFVITIFVLIGVISAFIFNSLHLNNAKVIADGDPVLNEFDCETQLKNNIKIHSSQQSNCCYYTLNDDSVLITELPKQSETDSAVVYDIPTMIDNKTVAGIFDLELYGSNSEKIAIVNIPDNMIIVGSMWFNAYVCPTSVQINLGHGNVWYNKIENGNFDMWGGENYDDCFCVAKDLDLGEFYSLFDSEDEYFSENSIYISQSNESYYSSASNPLSQFVSAGFVTIVGGNAPSTGVALNVILPTAIILLVAATTMVVWKKKEQF